MSATLTGNGLNIVTDLLVSKLTYVAVGIGTTNESELDTSLESEIYRSNVSNSNVSITSTSNNGELEASISIAGGTEVDPGVEITEIGVFAENGELFYRETREAVKIISGERIAFTFTIDFNNT